MAKPGAKKEPKVVVVVPAYNEGSGIHYTLAQLSRLKEKGLIHGVVVVDDGSRDNTVAVAKKHGAEVVSHKRNMGKGYSFVSGARKARQMGADVMITADADLIRFPEESVRAMVGKVTSGGYHMAIAQQYEIPYMSPINEDTKELGIVHNKAFVGSRAINMKALRPMFRRSRKWLDALTVRDKDVLPHEPSPKELERWAAARKLPRVGKKEARARRAGDKSPERWTLEPALDLLIPGKKAIWLSSQAGNPEADIYTLSAYRTGIPEWSEDEQYQSRDLVSGYFQTRRRAAEKLLKERKVRRSVKGRERPAGKKRL